ncbi:GGDEF domain-containing protein [Piscinibacter defluvii]|uniref:GGDEF domain-containing protein n=1 Tax=Piscinibacter defluvii TaxID=1796922 RepID=UPI000FDD4725|nr:GGDEF domain-containing protein [Piscinibacter defluvii]
MSAPTPSPASAAALAEQALAQVIADGAGAAALARRALALAGDERPQQAFAHVVLALVAFREGTLEDGQAELDAAIACAGAEPPPRLAWLIEHDRAMALRRRGELARAAELLGALHERGKGERPAVDRYLTLAALGIVVGMEGDNDASLDRFHEALATARESGVPSLVVNALNNLGSLQSDLYNLEDALGLLQECLSGALALGSKRQIIYAAGNLVQCLCLMGRPAEALAIAREQLIARIRPDDLPALQRDEEIAHVLLDNGLLDEAEARLGGVVHVDAMSNELATSRVWLLARILLARGRAAEALALCRARQALREGDESTVAIDRVNLDRVAAQAAAAVGDHELAYRLQCEAFATHELLLGRAARARYLSLQIRHRVQQAESERDLARGLAARLESLNASLREQAAENERLQERLRAQALEDALTGLHNRRYLQDAGAALVALTQRQGEPLAAALVDLDHFKHVNDRHGHAAGDQVLQAFARLVRGALRASDIVCRSGGEEFVLLLPGADAGQARVRLERLLERFRTVVFDGAGARFCCTFSAGVATARPGDGLERLLQRADAALYAAKDAGRARVVEASKESIET